MRDECKNAYTSAVTVLLRREGITISTSMVGRILTRLKTQGRLVEAPRTGVPGSRRALRPRPYGVRKPKQYAVAQPGDLVEVDTLEVRPVPGAVVQQFTARDVISRWDVLQAPTRATAQIATAFLDTLQHRMPLEITEDNVKVRLHRARALLRKSLYARAGMERKEAFTWLLLIAINLVSTGMFFDVAVRDVEMALAALVLARMTEARRDALESDISHEPSANAAVAA